MVAQWFKYMFRRGKAVLLNGVATHHERGNYIDGFQRASRPDWGREERVKYDTTFLIGTTGILGTGVTLNAAERMVLDCCLYVLRDEEQAYARIDRMGNLNHQVTTYRLVADAPVGGQDSSEASTTQGDLSSGHRHYPARVGQNVGR